MDRVFWRPGDNGHGDEGIRDLWEEPDRPGITYRECFDKFFRHIDPQRLYFAMMREDVQDLVPDTFFELVDMHRNHAQEYYDVADDSEYVPTYNIESLDEVLELPDEFFPRRSVLLFNRWAAVRFERWGHPVEYGGTLLRFLYWYAGDRWLANHAEDEAIDNNVPDHLWQDEFENDHRDGDENFGDM